MTLRSFARIVPFLLALAPIGCGLADYEFKMQLADARLDRIMAENELLGDPLILPTGDAAPAANVFLRPPKGVSKNPVDPTETPLHYSATAGVCTDLYLWIGAKDDDKDKLKKRIENWLSSPMATWQPCAVQPPDGRPEIAFDAAVFTGVNAPAYRVYLHTTVSGVPAAVVFKVAQPAPAGADEAIKTSLESYADAADALKARADFVKRSSR